MDPSVERGIAVLKLYQGQVKSQQDDKVVIEFETIQRAIDWRRTYAMHVTTKFPPGQGYVLEVCNA